MKVWVVIIGGVIEEVFTEEYKYHDYLDSIYTDESVEVVEAYAR